MYSNAIISNKKQFAINGFTQAVKGFPCIRDIIVNRIF